MPRLSSQIRFAAAPMGARLGADFRCGSFAFVMATGIVSIAAALAGIDWIANPLLAVNAIVYPVLCLLLLLRLVYHPFAIVEDLQHHQRGPSLLTIVAGTCVLGNQVDLLTGHRGVAAALWILAATLWAVLVYCPFALGTRATKAMLASGPDGTWLLVVVATEALAIAGTHAAAMTTAPQLVVLASLCLFCLGSGLYPIVLILIILSWLSRPMTPDQFTPSYWINMGAASITALAGARLLTLTNTDPVLATLRGFVVGETVTFWSVATWWMPLLIALTFWCRRVWTLPGGYRLEHWSIVFPVGMYTAASWNVSHVVGLPHLMIVPRSLVWIAIAIWCVTVVGMVRHLDGLRRNYRDVSQRQLKAAD